MPTLDWQSLTTLDFAGLDADRTVAVLPVAAIEQHGPHLPVGTDAMINTGILDRALARLAGDVTVLRLPAMAVGKSNEHIAFPGTLTLSAETIIRLWTEIGEGVHRAGLRKLLLFNSHGGQPQIMDIVGRDLRVRLGMMVTSYSWMAGGLPPGLFPDAEVRFGIHAGAIETSLIQHLHPAAVRGERIADFPTAMAGHAGRFRFLNLTGPAPVAWQAQDVHPSGAAGDARLASADKGRQVAECAADRLAGLIGEIAAFDLAGLKPGPLDRRP